MFIQTIFACITCAVLCIVSSEVFYHNDPVVRPNHGVVFVPAAKKLLVGQSNFDLVFTTTRPRPMEINIPTCNKPLGQIYAASPAPDEDFNDWCSLFNAKERGQLAAFMKAIQVAEEGIQAMLQSPVTKQTANRQHRALLGFVGKLSRGLFGTATTGDVARLAAIVNNVVSSVNKQGAATTTDLRMLHSVVNSTSFMLKALQRETSLNKQQIVHIMSALRDSGNELHHTRMDLQNVAASLNNLKTYVTEVADKKVNVMVTLQVQSFILTSFLNALSTISQGSLSTYLVPPHVLTTALQKAQQLIKQNYPGYSLAHTDTLYYYSHHLASFLHTESHIIIHVQAPFSREDGIFNLYSLSAFPIPIQTNNDNTNLGYTTITDLTPYFAVDKTGNVYTEIDLGKFMSCSGQNLLTCPFDHVLKNRPKLTCAAALYFQQDSEYLNVCKTKIFPTLPLPDFVLPLGRGNYLITTSGNSYQVACTTQAIRKVSAAAYARVSVPCGCALHVSNLMVEPPLSDCNEDLREVNIMHPINYAMYLQFGFEPYHFNSVKLSNESLTLDLPNIDQYVKNFTDLSDTLKESGLDLAKVYSAIDEARRTYEKPQIQMDAEVTFLPFVEDNNFMAMFVICVVSAFAILIFVIVLLSVRVKRMSTILTAGYIAASTQAPKTAAKIITRSRSPISTTPVAMTMPTVTMTTLHYLSTLCVILLALILYKILLVISKVMLAKSKILQNLVMRKPETIQSNDKDSSFHTFNTNTLKDPTDYQPTTPNDDLSKLNKPSPKQPPSTASTTPFNSPSAPLLCPQTPNRTTAKNITKQKVTVVRYASPEK